MRKQFTLGCLSILMLVACPTGAQEASTHVMVANDDGYESPGLAAIAEILAADPAYRITVIAPKHQQSVSGHGLVTRREIEVRKVENIAGSPTWLVDGTPATVARVGLTALLVDDPPDLIVSGINRGENDGLGAWTSGTVAVAREGALAGIPAVAVSLQLDWDDPQPDWEAAARWAKPVIDAVRDEGLPKGVHLNVNVPVDTGAILGYRMTRMALDPSEESRYVMARVDSDGVRWYTSRWKPPVVTEPGGDTHLLGLGWVTIAPLGLDQTAGAALPQLLQFEIPPPTSLPAP